ncbi:10637_t:CDS:2, partial [Cetraspora pellucida]
SSRTSAFAEMLDDDFGLGSSMNVSSLLPLLNETTQKKRTRKLSASTEKLFSKKAKKLIGRSLEETSESVSNFLQLSERIDHAETKNEEASQNLIFSYFNFKEAVFKLYKKLKLKFGKDGSEVIVKKEVRVAISKTKCSDEAL